MKKDYTYTYEGGKLVRATEGTVTLDGETVKGRTVQNKTVYTYGKDGQLKRKRISITNGSVYSEDYEYPEDGNMLVRYSYGNNILSHSKNDSFGRKLFYEIQFGKGVVSRQFAYHSGEKTEALAKKGRLKSSPVTSLVKTITYDDGRTIEYEYDGEERITKVTDSIDGVTEYTYDELGQLLTEKHNGVTVNSMTYDNYGNIKTKNGVSYTYDSVWKDLLTKVGSQTITYDEQGNPTDYLGHTLTWEKGRQLKSFDTNTYTYNANGIRTGKQTKKLRRDLFITEGSKLIYEDRNWYGLVPLYDNEGNICGIRYYSENYFFQKNLQGDIIAIKNQKGATVARYRYDAWGVPTIVEDISTDDEDWDGDGIATVNPFRYRGYYYDNETGLYYLQSRYYDPTIGRFINADCPELCMSPSKYSIKNIFTYGDNNLVNNADYFGTDAIWLQDMDNVGGLGHTGLLIQDSRRQWWHFYWGTNGAGKKGKSSVKAALTEYYGPTSLYYINKHYYNKNNGCKYEALIYFKGDFSRSKDAALTLTKNYNLIWDNCLQVSIDMLCKGRFTWYDSAFKIFLCRLRLAIVPNHAYIRMSIFNNIVQQWIYLPWYLRRGVLHPSKAAFVY